MNIQSLIMPQALATRWRLWRQVALDMKGLGFPRTKDQGSQGPFDWEDDHYQFVHRLGVGAGGVSQGPRQYKKQKRIGERTGASVHNQLLIIT